MMQQFHKLEFWKFYLLVINKNLQSQRRNSLSKVSMFRHLARRFSFSPVCPWLRTSNMGNCNPICARTMSAFNPFDPFTNFDRFVRQAENAFRNFEKEFGEYSIVQRKPWGFLGMRDSSTSEKFIVYFNFPQAEAENVNVTLKGRSLTVEANVETKMEGKASRGSSLTESKFQINIPEDVNLDEMSSDFNEGVLKLEAPRVKSAKKGPKTVHIKRE